MDATPPTLPAGLDQAQPPHPLPPGWACCPFPTPSSAAGTVPREQAGKRNLHAATATTLRAGLSLESSSSPVAASAMAVGFPSACCPRAVREATAEPGNVAGAGSCEGWRGKRGSPKAGRTQGEVQGSVEGALRSKGQRESTRGRDEPRMGTEEKRGGSLPLGAPPDAPSCHCGGRQSNWERILLGFWRPAPN